MQAAHPVHRPEVTTSVNSSAQCGFSGGMALPYRDGPGPRSTARPRPGPARVGYPRRVPELPEVENYRQLAEGALGRTVAKVSAPDPWFIKGGADGPALRRALTGHRLTAARRIGKLMLLDVEDGPTLGVRFGMTGSLMVDGAAGR